MKRRGTICHLGYSALSFHKPYPKRGKKEKPFARVKASGKKLEVLIIPNKLRQAHIQHRLTKKGRRI